VQRDDAACEQSVRDGLEADPPAIGTSPSNQSL
jgi:hypothetical protein